MNPVQEQLKERVSVWQSMENPSLLERFVLRNGKAMESTKRDPETCFYFGVPFEMSVLSKEILRTGWYGLLDTPTGYNIDFMFRRDPGLEEFLPEQHRRKAHA